MLNMAIYTWKRLVKRTLWSCHGLRATWVREHSFRTWVWANLVSGGLALWLPLSGAERGLILALGLLVLTVELLNTAIEDAIDYISTDEHPLAKRAKDAGSAAVMVAAIAAAAAWLAVLYGLVSS